MYDNNACSLIEVAQPAYIGQIELSCTAGLWSMPGGVSGDEILVATSRVLCAGVYHARKILSEKARGHQKSIFCNLNLGLR